MNDGILFYFQDPGGSNFFGDTLKNLQFTSNTKIIVHPLSYELIRKKIPSRIEKSERHLSKEHWINTLKENDISRVVSTLSSKFLDLSNCCLIQACNELGIPSLGFLDHWKGLERLTENGFLTYCPSKIGVIDEITSNRIQSLGVKKENIFIVGHPQLESRLNLGSKKEFNANIKKIKICLLSQPNTIDKSFISIFRRFEEDSELIDALIKIISLELQNAEFSFRPHPKENFKDLTSIKIDRSSWEKCLNKNHIFIGVNSITMLEAYLSGKIIIELNLEGLPVRNDEIPYQMGFNVRKLSELHGVLKKINENKIKLEDKNLEDLKESLLHSSKRLNKLVLSFLNN